MVKEGDMFVGREFYLNLLNTTIDDIKRGTANNVALIGPKNIGKSFLLKKFAQSLKNDSVTPIYIDLDKVAASPEEFCLSFISAACFAFKGGDFKKYKDIEFLLGLQLGEASKLIKDVKTEFEKIKPDYNLLVETAFRFPEALALHEKKKVIMIIDEFQNILDLENYDKLKDIINIFNSLNLKNIHFIAAGSYIQQMKEVCKNFKIIEIGYFNFEETKKLVNKLIKASDKEIDRIFKLSLGHPYFITAICNRYQETKDIDKAFVTETLSKQGMIYSSCNFSYNDSLNRARGKTLLMSIMNNLVYEDGLRLSEISRKIYRQSPVTKNLLTRLASVDLIIFKDNKYYVADKILKYWLSKIILGLEFDYIPEKILDKLVSELEI